jgi:signal transduction histidine kinase
VVTCHWSPGGPEQAQHDGYPSANTVKYTPTGGAVTVTITCPDDRVVLAVADTGIPAAERDTLFKRFY